MEIDDLLKIIEDIEIPYKFSNGSFKSNFKELFNNLIKRINKLEDKQSFYYGSENKFINIEEIKSKYKHLISNLILSLEYYFEGNIYKSQCKFKFALTGNLLNDSTSHFRLIHVKPGIHWYRLRKNETNYFENFTKNEMFHVPFQLRNTITTKRYSIPGYPCLYLSSSTYLCWVELNKPDINKVTASRFKSKNGITLLNLSKPDLNKANSEEKLDYFMIFPLLLACSIKVNNDFDIFKPEYIFPQFLLEYVKTENELDGIKYESTKLNNDLIEHLEHYNIVMPVKKTENEGYCNELLNYFEISIPIDFQILDIATPKYPLPNVLIDKINAKYTKFNSLSFNDQTTSRSKKYGRSTFGVMEMKFLERDGE